MVIFEKWYDKLFNVKYLYLFHPFKAIYQFRKHIIFLVKIVANVSLSINNSLGNRTYTPTTLTRGNPEQSLAFQPKTKNWIFRHSTELLNITHVSLQTALY